MQFIYIYTMQRQDTKEARHDKWTKKKRRRKTISCILKDLRWSQTTRNARSGDDYSQRWRKKILLHARLSISECDHFSFGSRRNSRRRNRHRICCYRMLRECCRSQKSITQQFCDHWCYYYHIQSLAPWIRWTKAMDYYSPIQITKYISHAKITTTKILHLQHFIIRAWRFSTKIENNQKLLVRQRAKLAISERWEAGMAKHTTREYNAFFSRLWSWPVVVCRMVSTMRYRCMLLLRLHGFLLVYNIDVDRFTRIIGCSVLCSVMQLTHKYPSLSSFQHHRLCQT